MNLDQVLAEESMQKVFERYERQYKAVADRKRLHILYELTQYDSVCVCELVNKLGLPQSKLSYHLKILLDAGLIKKKTEGTWSYYSLNDVQVNHLLSEELCCLFRSSSVPTSGNSCCHLTKKG